MALTDPGRVHEVELVSLDEVRAAEQRLAEVLQRTPLESSRALSETCGYEVLLKCENLQRTGSFKIRGAFNRIARLTAAERARGVVCASAGNHAQGVALAARLHDVEATVFMPEAAPLPKVAATRGYGAEVRLTGADFDESLAAALAHVDETGAVFVHPFDHRDVIAGQGTLGLEILEALPETGTIVVPVGGGGLVAGIAVAARSVGDGLRVVGVQAEGAAAYRPSLEAGRPTAPEAPVDTIADGIAVKQPGELAFAHVRELVDEVVEVTDADIARAVGLLLERAKLAVEPAGAAGVAALLAGRDLVPPVVVVLSGGNIDLLLLHHLVTAGLTEEGRFVTISTRVPDQPGQLHALLGMIADEGANVVGVEHHRFGRRLRLREVQVILELETRGPDHVEALRRRMTEAGYTFVRV